MAEIDNPNSVNAENDSRMDPGLRESPRGLIDHKSVHISHIDPLVIVKPRQLSRSPGSILESFSVSIRSIRQKSPHRFTIEWTDGKLSEYRLSDLQRICPCAKCRDEKTGQMLIDPASIPEDLGAHRIVSVGRYALQIYFSKGCSKGIYPFKLLRGLHNCTQRI